ncbi:ThuA domain-containing protein [Leifsonia virtsii]|uniref:ThuA domain-containing protein n=1 Tax=Leifsonia virtsii TaxID=3035915 RepID=A0ABT8J1K4_9MICO|nr:ThuA domain-containing protein [Leifsonia virtsii]MDN4598968.1 ThuA domain-containing protein [Leifsonia virtsii]
MATATVMLVGDDVYEDLFGAGVELQALLAEEGLATRVRIGAGALRDAQTADGVIALYRAAGELDDAERRGLEEAVSGGAGLLAVHSTAYLEDDELAPVIGARYVDHGPRPHESRFAVQLAPHPVTAGVAPFQLEHEHYRLAVQPGVDVLAWREAPYGREPLVTAHSYGRGRVCYLQFGHDLRAWGEPEVRRLVTNAARWLAAPTTTRPNDAEDTNPL